jgi:hypothetical protein
VDDGLLRAGEPSRATRPPDEPPQPAASSEDATAAQVQATRMGGRTMVDSFAGDEVPLPQEVSPLP